jgi:flagellar biosynthesis protein FlhF
MNCMQLYTFKARSIAEALHVVREELGPDASVLHTRDMGSPLLRLLGGRLIEVTASAELSAPSRLPELPVVAGRRVPAAELEDFRWKIRQDVLVTAKTESSLVERLAAEQE